MSSEENEDVYITLNYQGIQKKIEFDFDYNNLLKKAFKSFGIDKNEYDLVFYYYNEDQEKKGIENEISPCDFETIYKDNNEDLMIYIDKKLKQKPMEKKKQVVNNDIQNSNLSLDIAGSSFNNIGENDFYKDIDDNADKMELNSKTEENKEMGNKLKNKCSFDKKGISSNKSELKHISSFSKNNCKYTLLNLEQIKNKSNDILKRKQNLESKNEQLNKKINQIKELIEKSKIEKKHKDDNNKDDRVKKLLIQIQNEKAKLEKMEKAKLKEIADLKAKNLNIQKKISTLSKKLDKQIEGNKKQNFLEENSISRLSEFKDKQKDSIISLHIGADESKKEKKRKKLEKINELFKQKKKKLNNSMIIQMQNVRNVEQSYKSIIIKKNNSHILNKKEKEEQIENGNDIKKENEYLKYEIKNMEDKLSITQKEIEDMKRFFEEEIKNIEEKGE